VKRFYSDNITSGIALLSEEESHHCLQVLRLDSGVEVELVNGKGMLWQARVEKLSKKQAALRIVDLLQSESINHSYFHLAVAITKNPDRIEWLLEKASEMGLASLHPIITERTERNRIRTDRLEKIAVSAMKQSLSLWKPIIHEPLSLGKWIQDIPPDEDKFIAHCMPTGNKPLLSSVVKKHSHTWLAIGPEGDFTEQEVKMALSKGFIPVSLGDTRLRVETAALAACAYIYLNNQTV
jgi:16S rRNA (uracil1498-N3)-methyltransferase